MARSSDSSYAHNVIVVKKKHETTARRFVVDYRTLNDVTVKDAYPMPNIGQDARV